MLKQSSAWINSKPQHRGAGAFYKLFFLGEIKMENQNNIVTDNQGSELDNLCMDCREQWEDLCIEIEMLENEIQNDISNDKPDSYIRATHILRGRGKSWKQELYFNPDGSSDLYIFLPKDDFKFLRTGYYLPNNRVIRNIYTKEEIEQRASEFSEFMDKEEQQKIQSSNNTIEDQTLSLIQ
jgi:hypothetical protein